MTEKLIHSLPPTTALPPFVTFEDCKKGETAAKTGCTPSSGGGGKKPTDEEVDEFEKDLDKRSREAEGKTTLGDELEKYDSVKAETKKSMGEDFDEDDFNEWYIGKVPSIEDHISGESGEEEAPAAEDKKKEEDWRHRERSLDTGTRGDTRRVAEAAGMTSRIGDANVSKKDKETLRVLMDHFDANWDKWKNQKGESFSPDEFKDWFSAQVPGLKDAIEKGN